MSPVQEPEPYHFIVVGAGPAGLSAALVAQGNGLKTLVLETRREVGGQVRLIDHPLYDVLGAQLPLAPAMQSQVDRLGLPLRTGCRVDRIIVQHGLCEVQVEGAPSLEADRVLLATGLEARRLGVPGESLVETEKARVNAARFSGVAVAVVGGGDEACDTARVLQEAGARVHLLSRSALRARPRFVEALQRSGAEVRTQIRVKRFLGDSSLEAIELEGGEQLSVGACFVRIGGKPVLPAVEPELERDDHGLLRVGHDLRTSNREIFAAGDLIVPPERRYVARAMGDGVVVARVVESDLRALGRLEPTAR